MSIRRGAAHGFVVNRDAGGISSIKPDDFVSGIEMVNAGTISGFIVPGTVSLFLKQCERLSVYGLRCLGGGFQLLQTELKFHAEDMQVDGVGYIVFSKW
jgi:hypothetical protein